MPSKQPELTQLKDEFDPHFVACHHSDHVGVINFKELDHQVIERETDREALLKVEHINAWYGQQQALLISHFNSKR